VGLLVGSGNRIAGLPPFQYHGTQDRLPISGCRHSDFDAQEAGMNKFVGIDLHSNNSVVVISDEADRITCSA
jgi:hypothetical protein